MPGAICRVICGAEERTVVGQTINISASSQWKIGALLLQIAGRQTVGGGRYVLYTKDHFYKWG